MHNSINSCDSNYLTEMYKFRDGRMRGWDVGGGWDAVGWDREYCICQG